MGNGKYVMLLIVFSVTLFSCNKLYKAGNLVALILPVETPLRSQVIRQYLDTLIQRKGYKVPTKWAHYDKLVDLDSVYNKRIYFKSAPEEMYLISFGGMITISDVFNPEIKNGDWVSEKELMSAADILRVKKRFKTEILDIIEMLAKEDGLPDSIIYYSR